MKLFGFTISKSKDEKKNERIETFAKESYKEEGAHVVDLPNGQIQNAFLKLDFNPKSEAERIKKYREMANDLDVNRAIEDIINESIVIEDDEPVYPILDNTEFSDKIKTKIGQEFQNILYLLNFNRKGYEIFRRWYVDGRTYYHIAVNENKKKDGIQKLFYIDPMNITKIVQTQTKEQTNGKEKTKKVREFFFYTPMSEDDQTFPIHWSAKPWKNTSLGSYNQKDGVMIYPDAIAYVNSGLIDPNKGTVISHLEKAIMPKNQLNLVETAIVIYRLARAPERRAFYIDVGGLPKQKAEEYLQNISNKYSNKMIYDASTGEINANKALLSMMEDYWLPRKEGGRGTEISSVGGNSQGLGDIEDILYFRRKFYNSLNVPITRLESEDRGIHLGKAQEISRDELKFFRFITRLRTQFSSLFRQLLKTQLLLKEIITKDEWEKNEQRIRFKYNDDNFFAEDKRMQIMSDRLGILRDINDYTRTYYSKDWVRRNILGQTNEEIKEIDKQIEKEKAKAPEEEEQQGGGSFGRF